MRYLGGKSRLVPFLSDAIRLTGRTRYVEPFVGGGSVLAGLCPHFDEIEAGDSHPDLVSLWNAVLDGWVPPATVSLDQYEELRHQVDASPLRAYAGFACSFGGKWFGGYARKSDGTPDQAGSRASLLRKADQIRPRVSHIRQASFEDYAADPKSVIYCDPPYVTSADYSTASWRPYDFWDTARDWTASGAVVLVSEFQAPSDFVQIAETERAVSIQRTTSRRPRTSERLFTHSSTADLFRHFDADLFSTTGSQP